MLSFLCISLLTHILSSVKWPPCVTPWSLPCWILWFNLWETKMSKKRYTNFWRRKVLFCDYYFSSTNEWCLFILYSSGHQWNYSPEYHRNIIKIFLMVVYYFHTVLFFFFSILALSNVTVLDIGDALEMLRSIVQDESSH